MDGLLVTYGTEMDDFNPVSQVQSCQACSSMVVPASWLIEEFLLQIPATFHGSSCAQCFISLTPQQIAFHCFSDTY